MLEFAMDPQQAVDALRFCISPADGIVWLEEGTSDETIQDLQKLGHTIQVLRGYDRYKMGRAQVIANRKDPRTMMRYLIGGADPRGDGYCAAML